MDGLFWNIQLANYYAALETVAAAVAVLILISSLDDLFIDVWYWTRETWRTLTVKKRREYKPLTQQDLLQRPEQPLAIMVPAWMEYDVIAQMVENMINVLDYREYVVFVGTYPNDQATIDEVERMRRRYKRLRRVEVPHDGPTSKADCLNWLILSIFDYEKRHDIEFAGVILHDSEDVLHPMELRFFNYLLPRKDMIQLPVTSLDREWYELVAGVYMDEFAEWHAKDLVVRESVSGMVPSAGVGTCFSRRALLALSEQTDNQPFNTDSLTEDYDVGARLAAMGMHSIFARFPVHFLVRRPSWFGWGRYASAPSRWRCACANTSPTTSARRTGRKHAGCWASACRAGKRWGGAGRWPPSTCWPATARASSPRSSASSPTSSSCSCCCSGC